MSKYKNMDEVFKSWGAKNKKLPANNALLKSEILDQVNASATPSQNYREVNKSPLPWFSLSFAVLSVIVFVSSFGNVTNTLRVSDVVYTPSSPSIVRDPSAVKSNTYEEKLAPQIKTSSNYGEGLGLSSAPSSNGVSDLPRAPIINEDYRKIDTSPTLVDDREFLKTYYGASLYTRDVDITANRIGGIVRGFGGRVDGSNASPDYGYISFAIPADKLEIFRNQVKGLTLEKLFLEQISTENLLPQKQYIEKEQSQVENNISSVKGERTRLNNNHLGTIETYNIQIANINREINSLNIEWQNSGYDRRLQISARLNVLYSNKSAIETSIHNENASYVSRLDTINAQLKKLGANLSSIKAEDSNLLENVATVTGSINLKHISLWGIADIYTPGPLLAYLLGLMALLSYFWRSNTRGIVIN